MADSSSVELNAAHAPHANAVKAFNQVLPTIKHKLVALRKHWDQHEPKMFTRVKDLSDAQLEDIVVERDLVEVRSGITTYGTLIFGKIRLVNVKDGQEGFFHVRIHDPPDEDKSTKDVTYHSIYTQEGAPDASGHHTWRAILNRDDPLEFFNE